MSDRIRRPDLEAQAVSFPDYLIDRVLPFYGKPQIAGTMYYQDYTADYTAQYGRNTALTSSSSITANTMTAGTVTFTTSEVRARVRMGYTQVKGYSSKDAADLAMGRLAKRSYFNKIELLGAKALLDVAAPIDATSDVAGIIDANVTAVRDLGIGRVGLVMSNHNFVALKNNETIKARMQNTGVAIYGLEPRAITPAQMAAIFSADEVLVGKDDIWYTGLDDADKNNIAIVVLPEKEIEPAETVQLGRTVYFEFDGVDDRLVMESFHDDQLDADVVDAKGLVDVKLLNSELCKTLKIAASSSAAA